MISTTSVATPGYTFLWEGPEGFTSILEDLTYLNDGVYDVNVSDANGCTESLIANVLNPLRVTNSLDDGEIGTLRYALNYANSHINVQQEPDKIIFDIPGEGVHTIQPITPLPNISESVIIDGYTQPGSVRATTSSAATLIIELDGSFIPSEESWQMGLTLWGGSSIIKGLMINNFGDAGIHIEGHLDQTGITPCFNNIIEGNFIGVDYNGEPKGNKVGGIRIWRSTGNVIGGDNPENRNVITGGPTNQWGEGTWGILILLPESSGNIVKGNYIGIGPMGKPDLIPLKSAYVLMKVHMTIFWVR